MLISPYSSCGCRKYVINTLASSAAAVRATEALSAEAGVWVGSYDEADTISRMVTVNAIH
jgi:hypothetical protein